MKESVLLLSTFDKFLVEIMLELDFSKNVVTLVQLCFSILGLYFSYDPKVRRMYLSF